MKAQYAVGLSLSWPRVSTVFLIDVGILALAGHWPGDPRYTEHAWWTGVGVAALVAVVALGAYHRVPFSTALAARLRDRSVDPQTLVAEEHTRAIDYRRRYGRDPIGIREDRGRLVTVIAVAARPGPAGSAAGWHRSGAGAATAVPVGLVATALRQFDVRLDGIDIVSVRNYAAAAEVADGADGETADPERDDTHRAASTTWLVLRMDAQDNAGAIAARDSVAATLAVATERLAQELDTRHVSARALTADELADIDTAALAGLQARKIKDPRQYVTICWLSPHDITSENLEQLWLPSADAAVVTVRLVPLRDRTEVSVLARYHSTEKLPKDERAGLNRFIGRRLAAVYPSLPVPAHRPMPAVPARELADDDELAVTIDPADHQSAVGAGAAP